jgi:hypothetical protein
MPYNLILPSLKTAAPAAQTLELAKYLKQLVGELNWALNTIEASSAGAAAASTLSICDQISETGTRGIWNYVKYRSGRTELWGIKNISQQFTPTGSFYFSTADIELPFTLKNYWYGGGSHQWNFANWCNVVPKDNILSDVSIVTVMSYSNQDTTLDSAMLFIHVVGTWK